MRGKNTLYALLALCSLPALAAPDATQLAVWANEAIVATYTWDYSNYLAQQKQIARYFTAPGWTNYLTALQASGLPETVKSNSYYVSSVALLPPVVQASGDGKHWIADMPLLVLYKNAQYRQKQTLNVRLTFTEAQTNQGVRGLAIDSLRSTITSPPCRCQPPSAPDTSPSPKPTDAPPASPTKATQ